MIRSRNVFVALMPGGQPWTDRAFGTEQQACGAACAAIGVHWPQLAAQGWRIAAAMLCWAA